MKGKIVFSGRSLSTTAKNLAANRKQHSGENIVNKQRKGKR